MKEQDKKIPGVIEKKVYDATTRKGFPLWSGCMMYFPDALLAVAEHSRKGNYKHNPGQRLHWSKSKSTDHPDCAARHLQDAGPDWDAIDPEFGTLHMVAVAWRALAAVQMILEAKRAGMNVHDYIAKLKREAGEGPQPPAAAPTGPESEHACKSFDCLEPRGGAKYCRWRHECQAYRDAWTTVKPQ